MTSNKGSSESELLVVQNEEDRLTDSDADVIVVDEALREMTIEDYDRIYGLLSNASIELDSTVPVYDIAWQHILVTRRGRLLELVLFYLRMRAVVEAKQPSAIVCGTDVDLGYTSVLQDLGAELDIPVRNSAGYHRSIAITKRYLTSTLLVFPFVFDQLVSLLYRLVKPAPDDTDTIFVPALGRLDSMTPVLDRASIDYEVLVHSNASSWLWLALHSDLDAYDPLPISFFSSVGSLVEQFRLYLSVCRSVFFTSRLREELQSVVESEFGIRPDRTIEYALLNSFRTRLFTSFLLYHLFNRAIEELEPRQVVVGTLAPEGKSIVSSGINEGVEVYHVPHSVATWQCPNPPTELTQFVAGKLDKRYQTESPQVRRPWHQVVSGRPYLTRLYQHHDPERSPPEETDEKLRVLAATQPFDVSVAFVGDLVRAAELAESDVELVVKTHPSENLERYSQFEGSSVAVVGGDLFTRLREADVTVTISSNVGLESIVLGTPTACYNRWTPIRQPPPFARYGAIPVLDGIDAMVEFLDESSRRRLDDLQSEQAAFIRENYKLDGDAAMFIAEYLDSSLTL